MDPHRHTQNKSSDRTVKTVIMFLHKKEIEGLKNIKQQVSKQAQADTHSRMWLGLGANELYLLSINMPLHLYTFLHSTQLGGENDLGSKIPTPKSFSRIRNKAKQCLFPLRFSCALRKHSFTCCASSLMDTFLISLHSASRWELRLCDGDKIAAAQLRCILSFIKSHSTMVTSNKNKKGL